MRTIKKWNLGLATLLVAILSGCELDDPGAGARALELDAEEARLRGAPDAPVVLEMERAPERFHRKTIEVSDRGGRNRVWIDVVANDADALAAYDASTIQLRPGRQLPLAVPADDGGRDLESEPVGDPSDSSEIHVAFVVTRTQLEAGVRSYTLDFEHASTLKLPWKNYYYYSARDCVDVTRIKLFRRVYTWIYSRAAANLPYDLIRYEKLAFNETATECDPGSQRLKVRVRAKKENAFSVVFYTE